MKLRGTPSTKSVLHLVLLPWCLSNIQYAVAKWIDRQSVSADTNSASDNSNAKVTKSEEDPFRMMEDDINKDGFSFDKFMSEMHSDAFTKHDNDNGTNSDNDMKLDISKEMEATFPGHNNNVETTTTASFENQETTLCNTTNSSETSSTTMSTIVRRTTTSKVKYETTVAATVSTNDDHPAPPKRKSKSARQTTTVQSTTFPPAVHPKKEKKRHGKTLDNNGGQSAKNLNNQAPGIKNDHQLNGPSIASGTGYTVHSSEYNDYRDDQSYKKKSKVHENGTHHEPNKHSTFSKSHKHEHSENKHTQVTSSRDYYSTSTGEKPSHPESKPSSQQTHSKKGAKKGQSHSGKGGRKPTTAKPTKKAKVKSGGSKSKSSGTKAVVSGAKASTRKASSNKDTPAWKKKGSKSAPSSKHR